MFRLSRPRRDDVRAGPGDTVEIADGKAEILTVQ